MSNYVYYSGVDNDRLGQYYNDGQFGPALPPSGPSLNSDRKKRAHSTGREEGDSRHRRDDYNRPYQNGGPRSGSNTPISGYGGFGLSRNEDHPGFMGDKKRSTMYDTPSRPHYYHNNHHHHPQDDRGRQGKQSWETNSETAGDNSGSPSQGISRLFSKYADKCSMNGVPWIKQSKNPAVKVAWSLLLALAIAAMTYHLIRIFSTFYEYKKQTQVQLSFSSLQFPAITVCNVNPVRMSQRHLASDDFNEFIDRVDPQQIISQLNGWEPQYDTVDQYYQDVDDDTDRRRRRKRQATSTTSTDNSATIRDTNFFDEVDIGFNETREWAEAEDSFYNDNDGDSWEAESTKSAFYEIEETFREYFAWEGPKVRARMGHQISDMLLQCSFAGGTCRARNFTRVLSINYGNCYTLEYDKFISRESGPSGGLELKLFLDTDEYVPGIANSKGLQVVIHDQGTQPFPDEEGISVKSGSETVIGLKRIQVQRLGQPYAKCTPEESFIKQYGIKYTRTTCQKVCKQRRTMRVCGCYDILAQETNTLIRIPRNISACETRADIQCALRVSLNFETNSTDCNCNSPCSETDFERTVSSREWPNPPFASLLVETVCKHNYSNCDNLRAKDSGDMRNEFVKLVVYYESLNFEDLTESADYEIDQFLSDVGGTIGLWIGLSILAVFELFHLFTDILIYICCGRWRRKSPQERYKEQN